MPTSPLFDLKDRLALVTGSSRGIGRTLAGGLADAGAYVIVHGRDVARAEIAAAEIRSGGCRAEVAAFDVTDEATVEHGIAAIEDRIGPIGSATGNRGRGRLALRSAA
jgi:gluconate 5-dehydrogenase